MIADDVEKPEEMGMYIRKDKDDMMSSWYWTPSTSIVNLPAGDGLVQQVE